MTLSDPVADMLNRIRNAIMMRHDTVMVPASKIKIALGKVMKDEGFIGDYQIIKGKVQDDIKIYLRYTEKNDPFISGLERVSKPGLRIYVQRGEIPRVHGGMGVAIVSTARGVMTGKQAWREKVGGELICNVW